MTCSFIDCRHEVQYLGYESVEMCTGNEHYHVLNT